MSMAFVIFSNLDFIARVYCVVSCSKFESKQLGDF